jgi:hypothetical protein
MSIPTQVEALQSALLKVPGVKDAEINPRGTEGLDERVLSMPGEYADLPQVAIRRAGGGRKGEVLVVMDLRMSQDFAGWIGVEFLAWWVRDMARAGTQVQMRALALPPKGFGTQLGRTLHFVIELFMEVPGDSLEPVVKKAGEMAAELEDSLRQYTKVLAEPTMAAPGTIEELRRCAERDDAQAQVHLAQMLVEGDGMAQDVAKACEWLARAATLGHPWAARRLGVCYRDGEGVAKDPKQAFTWFYKAAEGGDAMGMGLVGFAYQTGRGVEPDYAKAVEWYAKGQELAEPGCTAQLGEMYECGQGVKRDLVKALACYEQALELGFEGVEPAIERVKKELGGVGVELGTPK